VWRKGRPDTTGSPSTQGRSHLYRPPWIRPRGLVRRLYCWRRLVAAPATTKAPDKHRAAKHGRGLSDQGRPAPVPPHRSSWCCRGDHGTPASLCEAGGWPCYGPARVAAAERGCSRALELVVFGCPCVSVLWTFAVARPSTLAPEDMLTRVSEGCTHTINIPQSQNTRREMFRRERSDSVAPRVTAGFATLY